MFFFLKSTHQFLIAVSLSPVIVIISLDGSIVTNYITHGIVIGIDIIQDISGDSQAPEITTQELEKTQYPAKNEKTIDEMIDDVSSPVYTKTNVELCTDEADCLTKESEKECLDGEIVIRVAENTEVYCSKFIRYNQIASGNKIVIEDVDKKAVYESTEALIEADEMAMLAANESLKCGKKVIARMLLLNFQTA